MVKHGEKLYYSIFRVLTRTTGTEVALKARCSTGLTVTEYMGSHLSYQTAEMTQAWIDSDKVISCSLRNDDKLKEDSLVYLQFAMLYTTHAGDRMIRIFNYQWRVCKTLYNYFKSVDVEACS